MSLLGKAGKHLPRRTGAPISLLPAEIQPGHGKRPTGPVTEKA